VTAPPAGGGRGRGNVLAEQALGLLMVVIPASLSLFESSGRRDTLNQVVQITATGGDPERLLILLRRSSYE
jgi:hypothetical protein